MIPGDIYEAASIDGASRTQQTWFVTIPMLKETFVINVVLMITGALKIFELVYQLTGGGPNHLSDVLVSYMYYVVFYFEPIRLWHGDRRLYPGRLDPRFVSLY